MKVTSTIDVYEIDNKEVPMGASERPALGVHSHWNRSELVVLEIGGKRWTVSATALAKAVSNAQNTGK